MPSSTPRPRFQFRPFDKRGPVKDAKDGYRAVTLFELHEYCEMIKKEGKFLLLVAGPTFRGDSRVEALETLFTVASLRVWSHACMDIRNARELLPRLSPQSSSDQEPETVRRPDR